MSTEEIVKGLVAPVPCQVGLCSGKAYWNCSSCNDDLCKNHYLIHYENGSRNIHCTNCVAVGKIKKCEVYGCKKYNCGMCCECAEYFCVKHLYKEDGGDASYTYCAYCIKFFTKLNKERDELDLHGITLVGQRYRLQKVIKIQKVIKKGGKFTHTAPRKQLKKITINVNGARRMLFDYTTGEELEYNWAFDKNKKLVINFL